MSTFNGKVGIIGKPEKWESPEFVKDFFSFIIGQPTIDKTLKRNQELIDEKIRMENFLEGRD